MGSVMKEITALPFLCQDCTLHSFSPSQLGRYTSFKPVGAEDVYDESQFRRISAIFAQNYPGGTYHRVYETGFRDYWIHRELIRLGFDNI